MILSAPKTKEGQNNPAAATALPRQENNSYVFQRYKNHSELSDQQAQQEVIKNSVQSKEMSNYQNIVDNSTHQNAITQLQAVADNYNETFSTQRKPNQPLDNETLSQWLPDGIVAQHKTSDASILNTSQQPAQLQGVVQLQGEAMERIATCTSTLWNGVKTLTVAGHEKKILPVILNSLSLLVAAIRYARDDKSIGAQFGTAFVTLLTAAEAAWTAVDEWKSATGSGKGLWDKRVGAMEKLATVFTLLASTIGIPINATTGAFIAAAGVGSIKVLRSAYDAFAKWYWPADDNGYEDL